MPAIYVNYPSGYVLKAAVRDKSHNVWYATGKKFEAWGTGGHSYIDYVTTGMNDAGGDRYYPVFSDDIPVGRYGLQVYLVDGSTYTFISGAEVDWWGTYAAVGPWTLPVTLQEAKNHLRVIGSDDDAYILALISAATNIAEAFQNRTYMQRQRVYKLDEFPAMVNLPYPPVTMVNAIQYVDANGQTQTLSSAKYQVDLDSGFARVMPAYGESWPTIRSVLGAVSISYTAGYEKVDDVPAEIKQAILLIVGHLYENRENVTEARLAKTPDGAERMLWPKRVLFRCDQES